MKENENIRKTTEHESKELVKAILNELNVEVRRELIQKYGWEAFMLDADAEKIHQDKFGVLYRLALADDHPLMAVKIVEEERSPRLAKRFWRWLCRWASYIAGKDVNGTARADDSYKDYMLRVDPQLRPMRINDKTGKFSFGDPQQLTARNAVASTFGLRGEWYLPEVETCK